MDVARLNFSHGDLPIAGVTNLIKVQRIGESYAMREPHPFDLCQQGVIRVYYYKNPSLLSFPGSAWERRFVCTADLSCNLGYLQEKAAERRDKSAV